MNGRTALAVVFLFSACGNAAAVEHGACIDTGYHWQQHDPDELRRIAGQCSKPLFSDLNYHRAYYLDLAKESEKLAGLVSWSYSESSANSRAHILYMQMVEQLAPHYYSSDEALAAWLVSEYEFRNEVAELWLHGYGNIAERLSELYPSD